ncbi:choice-of-anchor L domain-containing protein [Lacinutrix undariae]
MNLFRNYIIAIACISCNLIFSQQISVDNTYTAQQLIENELIQGCVEVSNVTSPINGTINGFGSFGYFEKEDSNFPFQNGIILATGNATSAGNSLNNDILNEGETSWTTDTDLEAALGVTGTVNATAIEFDFISISNRIQFNYILASEEYYANFPCEYSDGFAFLIKRAGTNDPYTNIALIPGSTAPVNTNTVHDEIIGFCDAQNAQYFEGNNVGDTNYNGRTTVMTALATITPNIQYHIKLVIADQTDENYDSAVFIEGNSFNASVELGNDITTCAETYSLNGDINNPDAIYTWYLNDNEILNANQPTYNVTETGTYTVVIEMPLSNDTCTIEDSITINLSTTQTSSPITDFELCDSDASNEIALFNLALKNTEVINSVASGNYEIAYYYTEEDAINLENEITTTIENTTNPQAIFVRVEDINSGCLAYNSFNLIVNPLPIITTPTILFACDDTVADGITQIDLTQKDGEIIGEATNLQVSYHTTLDTAVSGANAIVDLYTNTQETEDVFVRVTNTNTGCSTTTTLTISVLPKPEIKQEDIYIDACDEDHDGFATFDLTSIINEVLQGITGVETSFYETYDNAVTATDQITTPTAYNNIIANEQIIYIRVENAINGCASIAPVELHTNLLLTGTNIRDFSICDISNDNQESFGLNNMAGIIANGLEDVNVTFYENEADQNSNTNALDNNTPYPSSTTTQTLFITINSPTCSEVSQINLIINPIYEFESAGTLNYCDTDQDGLTPINLMSFDDLITEGQSDFSVMYFLTLEDAEFGINKLPNTYTNNVNPITLYTRITYNPTNCSSINSFEIDVLPAPVSSNPSDVIVCDDDLDGITILNLNAKIPELLENTNNRLITFHESQSNANSGSSVIGTPEAYSSATRRLFIRIENETTGCYSTQNFDVIVNTLPVFQDISNYTICEDTSDSYADFILGNKDAEILNGQAGKKTLYFTSQADADNRANAIDKTVEYENTSNPQTIFVRVENNSDENCYDTSSFIIEVGSNPLFNTPTDWFVCDDIANDGREFFNLNDKVSEITANIDDTLEVVFYTSFANAENAVNPINDLQFQNTVNPQQLYARIDNGSICSSITAFELNVIHVVEANPAQPLITCDTDNDGLTIFDLTDAEMDILTVRQNDITIAYYETMDDLEVENNPIITPTQYHNTSITQTVYVRLTNTISNCFIAIPLDLIVNLPPAINEFETYEICDNINHAFDLSEIDDIIVNDNFNVLITYYNTFEDAELEENILNTTYTYQTDSDIIYIRVAFSTTQCYTIYPFLLAVNPLPMTASPDDMEDCDDDLDGYLEFDLSLQTAEILNGENPNNFSVSYYPTLADAQNATNSLPLIHEVYAEQTIYVRAENNITGCFKIEKFAAIVHFKPLIDIDDQVICLENLPLLVSANTNHPGDTYLWSTNATTPETGITIPGTYWVTVTTIYGCENTRVFNVSESEQANIEVTETVDFSDPNNITITISGIGNYMYVLDNLEPQNSNVFENVAIGYHNVTVIDLNGCSEITTEVVVIDTPKFFTPNNDGYFDEWHITGVETLPGTSINIYDRYGKVLKHLTSSSRGWDGTYNGNIMPATDYWFVADVKKDGIEFEVKGHFSLRL